MIGCSRSKQGEKMANVRRSRRRNRNVYIAAPLFDSEQLSFNISLKRSLSKFFDVYLPQEDGGLMADMIADGMSPEVAAHTVFAADIRALQQCDFLLLLVDGRTFDEGAVFELGFAYSLGKLCYGLQTDKGHIGQSPKNPMISCSLRHMFQNLTELLSWGHRSAGVATAGDDSYSEKD